MGNVKAPRTQFADGPEGKIAYQVVGDGPIDLVFFPWLGWNLDLIWEDPQLERYLRRLASFSRAATTPSVRFRTLPYGSC